MGFRFRRSVKIAPGIRLNVGKRGFTSMSVGGRGYRVNVGKRGVTRSISIPGTGISHTQRISGPAKATSPSAESSNGSGAGRAFGAILLIFMVVGVLVSPEAPRAVALLPAALLAWLMWSWIRQGYKEAALVDAEGSDDPVVSAERVPQTSTTIDLPTISNPTGSYIDTESGPREPAWFPGTGRGYYVEAVGESNYQTQLAEVWAAARPERQISVRLTAEPSNAFDRNAVAIQTFRGVTIAYLGAGDAAKYQQLVSQIEAQGKVVVCQAKIHGGIKSKPSIGLWLDLEPPTIAAKTLGLTYKRVSGASAPVAPPGARTL